MRALHFVNRTFRLKTALAVLVVISLVAVAQAGAAWQPRATTERVSVATDGSQADGSSSYPSISAEGRYVTIQSDAIDLVSGDTNDKVDVFVHDRQTGVMERVSVATDGSQATGGNSYGSSISDDGRYVAFDSEATNLVTGDTNGAWDVFVRDRQTGTTERVSVATSGDQATGGNSWRSGISADGRYVTFDSEATNLVTGDTNGVLDIFVHDRQTGTTERVSVATSGDQATGGRSWRPGISADGRYVAFESEATNLVTGDTNGAWDVFVHDRQTGTTERVSVATNGSQATRGSSFPAISADGRHVTFSSQAAELVAGDTDGMVDIFVRDRQTGTTERVGVAPDGVQATGGESFHSKISADGRYVAFYSTKSNLVADDTNGNADIFVHDRRTGSTQRVSVSTDGAQGTTDVGEGFDISADGLYVTFSSHTNNFVSGDTNGNTDIFVRNILPADANFTPVAGTSRYDTAIKTSQEAFANGTADCVVIATGANWPDALGGAALASAKNGPILLTAPSALTAGITDEITRLGANEAYILGGTGAVSAEVETALIAKLGAANVHRVWGTSRYETAEAIAAATIAELETGAGYDGTAFVATAGNFPDALGASPLAAAKGWPIFLCNPAGNPPTAVMETLGVTKALILGGTGAISAAQESTLDEVFGAANVDRLWGTTRYATGVAVATYGVDEAGLVWNGLAMSTGVNFPDALAGGVLAGRNGSVMLLTAPDALSASVSAKLTDERDRIAKVYYLGGTGAISQDVRDQVSGILQ